MRTLFTLGFSGNPFWMQPSLGQQTLSDKDKSALYEQLVDTEGKIDIINEWKKNHPNVVADLGADAANYQNLETSMLSVQGTAKDLIKRTEAAEPAIVTLEELGQAENWMTYVQQMYLIVANHTGKHLPAPAAAEAAPPAASGVNPVVIGIAAAGLLTLILVALK